MTPKQSGGPVLIRAEAVYTVAEARAALGLAKATIGREVRLGRLRVSKRAGKYYILGAWLLEWIEAGELKRGVGANDRREDFLKTGDLTRSGV